MTTQYDTPGQDEKTLVAWVRANAERGRQAFGELAKRNGGWLTGLLRQMLPASAVDEVGQDTLLAAYLGIHSYADDVPFRAWVRGIASRRAFRWHRRRGVERKYEGAVDFSPVRGESGGDVEARDVVQLVLAELPYIYREAIVLRYVVLELGESAAKMRVKRARDEFQEQYEKVTR